LFKIYEGTSEIQRMVVSGFALGAYEPAMPPLEDLPIQREVDPEEMPAQQEGGKALWRCRMCGYVHYDVRPPDECPVCFFPKTAFKKA
ncbi:MAG: rubredoxin-like domain-containing protein, partial [Thermodesulfobacteriota bacterium]